MNRDINTRPSRIDERNVARRGDRLISGSMTLRGGNVRFQFTPIDHNVIWSPRLPGSPADILVTTNALVSRTFPTVGVYPFDCTVHPGMSGRIIVSP